MNTDQKILRRAPVGIIDLDGVRSIGNRIAIQAQPTPGDKTESRATKKPRIVPFGIKDVDDDSPGSAVLVEQNVVCENVPPHLLPPPLPTPPELSKVAVNSGSFSGPPASLPPITLPPVPVAPLSNGREPDLIPLSSIQCRPVDWLWQGRIPRGKLTLLVGDPGTGKSTITMDLVARLSTGGQMPDGSTCLPGHSIILNAEDGAEDTIKPRLLLHGANENNISLLMGVRQNETEHSFSLKTDLEALEKAIIQTGCQLVVVDPLSAYMPHINQFRDGDVRSVLAPLSKLAEQYNVAIIGISHLNKNSQVQILHRTQGSMGFVAAARSVLVVVPYLNDDNRRVLASIKNNLSKPPPILSFTMSDEGKNCWDETPVQHFDLEAALGDQKTRREGRKSEQAEQFLYQVLREGPVAAREVKEFADQNGIKKSTLDRAKQGMGIKSDKHGFGPDGEWYWSLPEGP